MRKSIRTAAAVASVGAVLAGAFYAGVAYAYDSRLDDADAFCVKAIALLKAADNPGVKKPFGGHRDKAIKELQDARDEISKAKTYADKHPGH